jgi:hypothetical protein
MDTCALVSAANDLCSALGVGTRPLAALAAATSSSRSASRVRHVSQNAAHHGRRFSSVIPSSWRPFLRTSEVLSPVYNVFLSNVFQVDETDHPACLRSARSARLDRSCLLAQRQPDREMCRADEPTARVRKLRQACNGIQCFGHQSFSAAIHRRGPPARRADRDEAEIVGQPAIVADSVLVADFAMEEQVSWFPAVRAHNRCASTERKKKSENRK